MNGPQTRADEQIDSTSDAEYLEPLQHVLVAEIVESTEELARNLGLARVLHPIPACVQKMLWDFVCDAGMEIGDVTVESNIPEVKHVLRQHCVHGFEAAHCEDSVLKRRIYSEAGVGASRAVFDEVGEGRMYNIDHAAFVLGYDEDGSKMLKYKSGSPHGETEKRVEGCRGKLVEDENS